MLLVCWLATGIAHANDDAKLPTKIGFYAAFDAPAEGLIKKEIVNKSSVADKQIVYLAAKPGLTGDDVEEIKAGHDSRQKPSISFKMTADGAVKMKRLSFDQLDHRIALVFDEEVIAAPKLRDSVNGCL